MVVICRYLYRPLPAKSTTKTCQVPQRKPAKCTSPRFYDILFCMKKGKYRPRIADSTLKDILSCTGAFYVEGPKWCGKNDNSRQTSGISLYMDETGKKDANLHLPSSIP